MQGYGRAGGVVTSAPRQRRSLRYNAVMNNLSTYLSGIALIVALVGISYGWSATKYCKEVVRWIEENNEKSLTLSQLTKIQTDLTEHADSITHLNKSLGKLRSRIGMRNLREKRENGGDDDEPDPVKEPEAYKRYMRRKLKLNVHK